jgi:hypothetical protein
MWVDCIVVGFAREAESLCLAGIGRRRMGSEWKWRMMLRYEDRERVFLCVCTIVPSCRASMKCTKFLAPSGYWHVIGASFHVQLARSHIMKERGSRYVFAHV